MSSFHFKAKTFTKSLMDGNVLKMFYIQSSLNIIDSQKCFQHVWQTLIQLERQRHFQAIFFVKSLTARNVCKIVERQSPIIIIIIYLWQTEMFATWERQRRCWPPSSEGEARVLRKFISMVVHHLSLCISNSA